MAICVGVLTRGFWPASVPVITGCLISWRLMATQMLANIGSGNNLLPCRHQAIARTNTNSLSTGLLGTHFIEIQIKIQNYSLKKMHLKISSANKIPAILPGVRVFTLFVQTSVKIHWGGVAQICVSKLTIIGSDNGVSPDRRQAIIWTISGILLIGPLGTNLSEILIEIHTFSFEKMHLKMPSAKRRPFCLGGRWVKA